VTKKSRNTWNPLKGGSRLENARMWILRTMHERVSFNLYKHLENILETLSSYGVHATFFISAEIAEKHPRIVQKICKNDHEIASHGYLHKVFFEVSREEAEREIAESIKILGRFHEVKGFRAPFLLRNKATYLACEKLGLSYDSSEHGLAKYCPDGFKVVVLPVVSPLDTHGFDLMRLGAKDLVARWLFQFGRSKGATVCMHTWRIGRKKYVRSVLEPLLKSDVPFVSASDLLHQDGVALTFDVEYTSFSESLDYFDLLKYTERKHVESLVARDFLRTIDEVF